MCDVCDMYLFGPSRLMCDVCDVRSFSPSRCDVCARVCLALPGLCVTCVTCVTCVCLALQGLCVNV